MLVGCKVNPILGGGGELTLAAMDEDSLENIGRKTYLFARRVLQDPELRKRVEARAAEIRAEEAADAST